MSKIAFIVPFYNYSLKHGGATKVYVDLAKKFQELGHEVEIITSLTDNFESCYNPFQKDTKISKVNEGLAIKVFETIWYKNVPNILFRSIYKIKPFFYPFSFINRFLTYIGPYFKGVESYIIGNNFDAVFINCLPYYYCIEIPFNLKKLQFKGKIILTPFFHTEKLDYYNPIFQESFDLSDEIHTVSNHEKKKILENFKINEKKIKTIPLFINEDEYLKLEDLQSEVTKFKTKYKLQNKKIILGILSSSLNSKGTEKTIEAFKKINNMKYVLILIGNMDNYLKSPGKNILNLGRIPTKDKNIAFAACDIFCMPSNSDSFGVVYLEAWKYKKPIVALDLPLMKELFSGGGLFAQDNNIDSLKYCLEKLLIDEKLRNNLGQKGFEILQEKYLIKNLLPKYLEITYNS